MLFARIHRRCCGRAALGSGEEALVHLSVTARLLEELLVMLFEDIIDYVDRFVGILQGNAVDAGVATLLVQTGPLAEHLLRHS
jgi:hypothetical protein